MDRLWADVALNGFWLLRGAVSTSLLKALTLEIERLTSHDGILSLSAASDKLFREELNNDKEIQSMIKDDKPSLTMFERWAVEDERKRTQQEQARAEQAEAELAILRERIRQLEEESLPSEPKGKQA